mmetsp:Transcript_20995/g.34418  ORF Transcript_20995/g.34418 Transcript_20995/m.34418 type:complete len:223 (-) Transcript_20995:272-940(-)
MNKRTNIERRGGVRIRKRRRRRGSTSIRAIVVIINDHGGRGLVLRRRMDTHPTPRQHHIPPKILGGVVIIEKTKPKRVLAIVMMIMIGTTHPIEGGIDMMIMMTAGGGGGGGSRVKKDEGEKGVQKDMMITIGMKGNPNVHLMEEGVREAQDTASIEKIQEESVILEEMVMELTRMVMIGTVCERIIIMNTMIGRSLQNKLPLQRRQQPKVTLALPRRKDMD